MADAAPDKPKKKRRGKVKKKTIEISLWVNCEKYEHGCVCTFCTKEPAVVHCPECKDFYCLACDYTAHTHKKRRDHIRTTLSKLTIDQASRLVTHATRYHGHLLTLQKKCRNVFRRYFDRETLNHYYYNPIYKTSSWRKPYCIRLEILFPFITPELAAARVQTLYRLWISRYTVIQLMKQHYAKVFDRAHRRFYYTYHSKSKLIPPQSWYRPQLCYVRSFPRDILPVFTVDVSALVIQRAWRALLVRRFFWAMVRAAYIQQFDPLTGKFKYMCYATGKDSVDKPALLGEQPWDPNYIPDWTEERVSIFLRRLGFRCYLKKFKEYGVDGYTLALLDREDFANLNVFNKVHIRKIEVEIAKLYKNTGQSLKLTDVHLLRRERIRKAKMFALSATMIQAIFRGYRSRKDIILTKEIARLKAVEAQNEREIEENGSWWMDRSAPFSLPPIKTFGRKADFLGSRGWGHWEDAEWVAAGSSSGAPPPPDPYERKSHVPTLPSLTFTDAHPTRIFTEKLAVGGYDKRRFQKFKGLHVDLYMPKPISDEFEL